MNSLPHFNSHLSNCEARQLQLENQSTIDSIWNDIFYENPKEVSSIGGSQRTISSQSCGMSTLLDDSPSSSMLSGFSSNHSFTCSSMSHSSYIPRKLLFPPIRECESPLLDKTMMGNLTDCSFLQNGTLHSHSPGSTVKDLTLSDLMSTLDLSNKGCLPCRTPVDANTREDIPSNSILSSGPSSCNSGIQSNNHLQSNFSSLNYTQNPPGPNSLTQLQKLWLPTHNPPSILSQRTGDLNDFLEVPGSTPPSPLSSIFPGYSAEYCAIEKAAKMHRSAAALCDPTCTWSGSLPVRATKNPFYSCKLFLGGVPWDVTEQNLRQAFMQFGSIQVEWPGKENSANPPKGYVYILFENDKQVKALVASCWQEFKSGSCYYKVSSRRMKQKEVQVIPWIISDSNYVRCPSYQLDPAKTVFVGALHGMITAEGLANIMNDLFAGVIYSGIDTDKHRYPIGSGRITFNNLQSYRKAVKAAFIEIKTRKFTKKIQVDPYLADSPCQLCCSQQGPYFCRDEKCFKYFCRSCWLMIHTSEVRSSHKPLMRDPKLRTPKTVTRFY